MFKRGFHYRCSREKCKARRTLAQRLEHYIRPPRCVCGGTAWRWDKHRATVERDPKLACECAGYAFRHRKGSKFCIFSRVELTADDIAARYGTSGDPLLLSCPF